MEQQQQQQKAAAVTPLRLAIINQVDFHLHVVAGAMHVLQQLQGRLEGRSCGAPIDVYLTDKVLRHNHFGFMDWLGPAVTAGGGFAFHDVSLLLPGAADHPTAPAPPDLAWFISPEFDVAWTAAALHKLRPRLALLYVHNGHMPQHDWAALRALSTPGVLLLTMSPHVADFVTQRLQQDGSSESSSSSGATAADWVLPIACAWPCKEPDAVSQAASSQARQRPSGCVISGSLDKALRDYEAMWQQLRARGPDALRHFKLKIVGDMFEGFEVPADLQELVQLHKSPPDTEFYAVVRQSCAIVPALGNPAYFSSKLTSAVITSLMAGVPVIADRRFLAAYRMLQPASVVLQGDGESELDAMLRAASLTDASCSATRAAIEQLRSQVNSQAVSQLTGWLQQAGCWPRRSVVL